MALIIGFLAAAVSVEIVHLRHAVSMHTMGSASLLANQGAARHGRFRLQLKTPAQCRQ
jgi:hypothetical protein